ncbi:HIT family protein [Sporosarcina sp. FSL K6-2383]|uniref:HIT family protein n=1 Tax=Sporosarcina sp. FSL K6-2383 TaxID=2921556 RepID=UPI00315ABA1B
MTACIFCKIIEGTIPSMKVYEDDHVYAFMDIMPASKGHVLLVPKTHCENIYDMTEQQASQLFAVAPKIANAIQAEFNPKGMNLLQNNGAFAGQAVFHFHLHFIPRYDEADGFNLAVKTNDTAYTAEQITEFSVGIRGKLGIQAC